MTPRLSLLALALPLLAACGGADGAPKAAPAPAASAAEAPPPPPLPPGSLAREDVDKALIAGPPRFLQRVQFEEVLRDRHFIGWKITAIPEEWQVEIQPGDVVTAVNGHSLERPTDAFAAWTTLARSREVKISYERAGAKKEYRMKIIGEPKQETVDALENGAGAAPRKPSPYGTVVIEDRDPSGEP